MGRLTDWLKVLTRVRELADAAREFQPLPAENRQRLEEAVIPFARGLMYYKP